jgi:hypothetical protein
MEAGEERRERFCSRLFFFSPRFVRKCFTVLFPPLNESELRAILAIGEIFLSKNI